MQVAHGLGNLLGQVNTLFPGKGFRPGVNALIEGGATTEAGQRNVVMVTTATNYLDPVPTLLQ